MIQKKTIIVTFTICRCLFGCTKMPIKTLVFIDECDYVLPCPAILNRETIAQFGYGQDISPLYAKPILAAKKSDAKAWVASLDQVVVCRHEEFGQQGKILRMSQEAVGEQFIYAVTRVVYGLNKFCLGGSLEGTPPGCSTIGPYTTGTIFAPDFNINYSETFDVPGTGSSVSVDIVDGDLTVSVVDGDQMDGGLIAGIGCSGGGNLYAFSTPAVCAFEEGFGMCCSNLEVNICLHGYMSCTGQILDRYTGEYD